MAHADPRARAIAAAERAYARALEAEHAAGKVLDRQIAAAGGSSYANKKGGAYRTALARAEAKAVATNKALRALEAARTAEPSAQAPIVVWQPGAPARPKARKTAAKKKARPFGLGALEWWKVKTDRSPGGVFVQARTGTEARHKARASGHGEPSSARKAEPSGKELAPTPAEREATARAGAAPEDRARLERFEAAIEARDAGAAVRALEVRPVANVELYNLIRAGRAAGNGYLVRVWDRGATDFVRFGGNEAAARKFADEVNAGKVEAAAATRARAEEMAAEQAKRIPPHKHPPAKHETAGAASGFRPELEGRNQKPKRTKGPRAAKKGPPSPPAPRAVPAQQAELFKPAPPTNTRKQLDLFVQAVGQMDFSALLGGRS